MEMEMSKTLTQPEVNNIGLGRNDFVEISNASVTASDIMPGMVFNALIVDSVATFSASTLAGDSLTSRTREAGRIILGRFLTVEETTGGVVLAYFGSE